MHEVFWLEDLKGKDQLQKLGIDGRITLEWILGRKGGNVWTGYVLLRIGTSKEPYEHGNEPLDSMKGREFLDQLSDYQLLVS